MKNYSALIVDLKKSRSYHNDDRVDIQRYIKDTIAILNKVFKNYLELDVVFSAGDELQGLFLSPKGAYLYFRMFSILVHPVELRAGIGVGEWSVQINGDISTEQDGSAYHNARHAIDSLDGVSQHSTLVFSGKREDVYVNFPTNLSINLGKEQSCHQNMLYVLSELMYPIYAKRKLELSEFKNLIKLVEDKNKIKYYSKLNLNNKHELDFKLIEKHFPLNGLLEESSFFIASGKIKGLSKNLSNILGTTRQSIDKSIKAGKVYQIRNTTIVALKLLEEYFPEEEV